jgi:NAD(P)-dependent dehydrogenase (short-subunit alcohol dehydrogenase family)
VSKISFEGQVAIVTGAGNGLGKSYALELARRGAAVVVNDTGGSGTGEGGSAAPADTVVAEIVAKGGKAVANYDSVATRAGGEAMVALALKTFGRVDVVIANAGILRDGDFQDLDDRKMDAVLDVHLKGSIYVAQAAYRVMMKQKYGRFVFVSSPGGMFGNPHQANYAAAKGGIFGLANAVGIEGAAHGILANTIAPNAATRLAQDVDPQTLEKLMPVVGKFMSAMTPDFVTPLAIFLASRDAPQDHGVYSAVGGRFARIFVGVTQGWYSSRTSPCSVEDVAAHLAQIEDRSRYTVPRMLFEEYIAVADGLS